jgi:hypothetical protein
MNEYSNTLYGTTAYDIKRQKEKENREGKQQQQKPHLNNALLEQKQ